MSNSFVWSAGLSSEVCPSTVQLSSFTNNTIEVCGELKLDVTIGMLSTQHTYIVADMEETDFLIGADFLRLYSIKIDMGNSRMQAPNIEPIEFLRLHQPQPKTRVNRIQVRLPKAITLEANSVTHIVAKLENNKLFRGGTCTSNTTFSGVLEPRDKLVDSLGVIIPRTAVLSEGKHVPMQMVNMTDERVTVFKNTRVAVFEPSVTAPLSGVNAVKCDSPNPKLDKKVPSLARPAAPLTTGWEKSGLVGALRVQEMDITDAQKKQVEDLVWKYQSVFSHHKNDIGTCNMFEGTIDLKTDHTPQWVPSRPIAYKHRGIVEEELQNLLEADVIEECTERSNWNSPVFLVAKPGQPGKYRWVADMRAVNTQTLPDNYELPNINRVVDKIGGCKLYSTFDLSQSFHQVNYDQKSRKVTAFSCNDKRYWYKKMVMGHCNSAQQFSRCMAMLLADVPFDQLVAFLDDLLLASDDVESHLFRLEYVLQRFKDANMKLTPNKCHFLKAEVKYVGLTISEAGLRITDDRIAAVKALQAPTTIKEVQSVLGFFNYNRKFVPKFAALAKPIYDLLGNGKGFQWSKECQTAFEDIKEEIANAITLSFPDLDDPLDSYQVKLDASNRGLGAELTQIVKGERRTIAFFSQKVPKHKREWGQTKLEFLAMLTSIEHWRIYLKGAKRFTVITDCASLLNLDTIFSKVNPTLVRKLQRLGEYQFDIEHISGKNNSVADFLSRYMYASKGKDQTTQTEAPLACVAETESEFSTRISPISVPEPIHTPHHAKTSQVNPEDTEMILPGYLFDMEHRKTQDTDVNRIVISHEEPSSVPKYCHCVSTPENVAVNAITPSCSTGDATGSHSPDLSTLTPNRFKELQAADPILSEVLSWVRNGSRPQTLQALRTPKELAAYWKQYSLLRVEEGILRRKWVDAKAQSESMLIVVPGALQEEVMELSHSTLLTAHPGAENSRGICLKHFYWYGMKEDFELFVAACTTCGRAKPPQAYLKAPLKHIMVHRFNDALVIDHIVPDKLGTTRSGNRYILSITDMWSGYVVAVPAKTQTAEETIRIILHRWVLLYGCPGEIISDCAPGFGANFFNTVLKAFGCQPRKGLPYKCNSTSKAERTNKRLNQALRVSLTEVQIPIWDVYLDYVCFALNSLKSRHTGFTANRLVFGRELNTPLSIILQNQEAMDHTTAQTSYGKAAYALHNDVKRIAHRVRKNANTDFKYADTCHEKSLHGPYFKVGDLCYTFVECPAHKFSYRWRGPFEVKKVINDHLYVVRLEGGEDKVCSISKLKHFKARERTMPVATSLSTHVSPPATTPDPAPIASPVVAPVATPVATPVRPVSTSAHPSTLPLCSQLASTSDIPTAPETEGVRILPDTIYAGPAGESPVPVSLGYPRRNIIKAPSRYTGYTPHE